MATIRRPAKGFARVLFSSGELVRILHGGHPIKSMGFSSDGRQLAVGSKSVELWDLNRYEKQ